ncbi:MAG: P63C domain-containing protein [Sedimentisphaerales bacterium]|nr:P63C domain-containing protein [Sedimentisphaerales bacterium]
MTDNEHGDIQKQPKNEAARELSKLGASKGGKARAQSLTREERSAIARNAVVKRWQRAGKNTAVAKATHEGPLCIGDLAIPCAVLDDGTRVLSQRGFAKAIGGGKPMSMTRRGAGNLPALLNATNLKPFIGEELTAAAKPIPYVAMHGGPPAYGIRAEAIPMICRVWLEARDANKLHKRQEHLAVQADIIIRGLATVGIVALVDEATGYQDDRIKNGLAKILEAFVAKELRPWVHTFPVDYYRQMYRLKGLEYPPQKANRMPRYFGKLTNDIVYARLAPGVLEELKRITERDKHGRLKTHLHRRLTADIGHPKLQMHLGAVTALMKVVEDGDWPGFMKLLDKHYERQTIGPHLFEGQETREPKILPAGKP